jgi:hypothetical protein
MKHTNCDAPPVATLLLIFHEITKDLPDGQPWPPDGDGWVLVRSRAGVSLWRRIYIDHGNR